MFDELGGVRVIVGERKDIRDLVLDRDIERNEVDRHRVGIGAAAGSGDEELFFALDVGHAPDDHAGLDLTGLALADAEGEHAFGGEAADGFEWPGQLQVRAAGELRDRTAKMLENPGLIRSQKHEARQQI